MYFPRNISISGTAVGGFFKINVHRHDCTHASKSIVAAGNVRGRGRGNNQAPVHHYEVQCKYLYIR